MTSRTLTIRLEEDGWRWLEQVMQQAIGTFGADPVKDRVYMELYDEWHRYCDHTRHGTRHDVCPKANVVPDEGEVWFCYCHGYLVVDREPGEPTVDEHTAAMEDMAADPYFEEAHCHEWEDT